MVVFEYNAINVPNHHFVHVYFKFSCVCVKDFVERPRLQVRQGLVT